jgi:hypothetical protein
MNRPFHKELAYLYLDGFSLKVLEEKRESSGRWYSYSWIPSPTAEARPWAFTCTPKKAPPSGRTSWET